MLITKNEYMRKLASPQNNRSKCTEFISDEYYSQFVTVPMVNALREHFGSRNVAKMYLDDPHFNEISDETHRELFLLYRNTANSELIKKAGEDPDVGFYGCIFACALNQIAKYG